MKHLLLYYKLLILDFLVTLIITICTMLVLLREFSNLNLSGLLVLGSMLPLIIALEFVILDIGYVKNHKYLGNITTDEYTSNLGRENMKLKRRQYVIEYTLYFLSMLVTVSSIVIIAMLISDLTIESIISYLCLIALGVPHFFVSKKRL